MLPLLALAAVHEPFARAQEGGEGVRFPPFSAAPSDVIAAYYNASNQDPGVLRSFLATVSLLSEAARHTGLLSNLDPATSFWYRYGHVDSRRLATTAYDFP